MTRPDEKDMVLGKLRECYPHLTDEQLEAVQHTLAGLLVILQRIAEREIQVREDEDGGEIDKTA